MLSALVWVRLTLVSIAGQLSDVKAQAATCSAADGVAQGELLGAAEGR